MHQVRNARAQLAENVVHDSEREQFYAQTFSSFDRDQSGWLDDVETKELLRHTLPQVAGKRLNQRQIEEKTAIMVRKMDKDGNGQLSYSEFVTWTEQVTARDRGVIE